METTRCTSLIQCILFVKAVFVELEFGSVFLIGSGFFFMYTSMGRRYQKGVTQSLYLCMYLNKSYYSFGIFFSFALFHGFLLYRYLILKVLIDGMDNAHFVELIPNPSV